MLIWYHKKRWGGGVALPSRNSQIPPVETFIITKKQTEQGNGFVRFVRHREIPLPLFFPPSSGIMNPEGKQRRKNMRNQNLSVPNNKFDIIFLLYVGLMWLQSYTMNL